MPSIDDGSRVIRLRVNAADCMAVHDVVTSTGLYTPGMSFACAVSKTLAVLLEVARAERRVPLRNLSEYSELMIRFPNDVPITRKRAAAAVFTDARQQVEVRGGTVQDLTQFAVENAREREQWLRENAVHPLLAATRARNAALMEEKLRDYQAWQRNRKQPEMDALDILEAKQVEEARAILAKQDSAESSHE